MVRKTLSDLHVAIKDGKIDVVKDLLEKKVDLHRYAKIVQILFIATLSKSLNYSLCT